jgi:hypothetical protein
MSSFQVQVTKLKRGFHLEMASILLATKQFRLRRAVGRLWRSQGGRHRAGRRTTGRGPWARSSSSLHFPRLGSGQGELGSTAASPWSMATGFERARTVKLTVETIFVDFLSARCSTKCSQEIQIRIFEIFHFGWSTYWPRFPVIFLLQRNVKFCRNLISNLKFGHWFRFRVW